MTTQCCLCHRIRVKEEWWQEPVELKGDISYAYCPVCLARTLSEIREYHCVNSGAAALLQSA